MNTDQYEDKAINCEPWT